MLAGVVALGFAGPALAKPGHGHGNGHANSYGAEDEGDDERVGQGGYGDDEADDQDEGLGQGYGVGGCPPGLAKKNPPCIPPGLARGQAVVGQGVPYGYSAAPYGYSATPYGPYSGTPYAAPYYGNAYPYQMDPRALLVQQVIGALRR